MTNVFLSLDVNGVQSLSNEISRLLKDLVLLSSPSSFLGLNFQITLSVVTGISSCDQILLLNSNQR